MKIVVNIARVLVGVLFIFSGLVKANDPLGLSYKMQEFFEVWGLHGFNTWTLTMSVLMNAFEIIAGFALLLGWRIKIVSWLLLILILFFTFLTGYTYVTGMPKNCGCFGDCLPISSKTSFLKDVALTILIAFLLWKRKYIKPLFAERGVAISMLLVIFFSFGFQWYTLNYLPIVDCLPYKKGNNISEKMKMPADAVPPLTEITFVYDKKGQQVEFTATNFPADFNSTDYKMIKRYDKIIREGKNYEPSIKGFTLTGETNVDSTEYVLTRPLAILLFIEKISAAGNEWQNKFEKIYSAAKTKNISCYIVTSEPAKALAEAQKTMFADIQIFKCDYKAIETAARAIPTLYLLKQGTIVDKWSVKSMQRVISLLQ